MKSVLISIQPRWCELIANGKKTVEIRKTRPKLDVPFKVYIYCTNSKDMLWILRQNERNSEKIASIFTAKDVGGATKANGKVIGEFVCDRIDHYEMEGYDKSDTIYQNIRSIEGDEEYDNFSWVMEVSNDMSEVEISDSRLLKQSCLSFDDIGECVAGGKEFGFYDFYGWHISDLVIYDKPKELSEFCRYDNTYDNAFGYAFEDRNKYIPLTRPPQSWCYVEEGGAEQ